LCRKKDSLIYPNSTSFLRFLENFHFLLFIPGRQNEFFSIPHLFTHASKRGRGISLGLLFSHDSFFGSCFQKPSKNSETVCIWTPPARFALIIKRPKSFYRSKDGKKENAFYALEWLAAMRSLVPNKGEQMVRYYGYYSNVSRGNRKEQNEDELIPSVLESDESSKERRKNWATLIQEIYEVDPLTCPKCHGLMRIIGVIEDQDVIKRFSTISAFGRLSPGPHPQSRKRSRDTPSPISIIQTRRFPFQCYIEKRVQGLIPARNTPRKKVTQISTLSCKQEHSPATATLRFPKNFYPEEQLSSSGHIPNLYHGHL
jgi:hypothetical protein